MAFPLLPSLNKNSKIALPRSGEWMTGAQNTLSGLVDSLKVVANKNSDISSIPDVWARPVLAEAILKDASHPQHQVYVDEWRGILGIMAMRKIRGFSKVQLQTLDVPAVDKISDNDPKFLKVIARSIPPEYAAYKDSTLKSGMQAKIQILTYEDKPLAFVWPSILVCPAVELDTYRAMEVPWWDFDGLHDPTEELSDDEKNSMVTWLQQIIDSAEGDSLIGLLTKFRDDVKDSLGENYTDTPLKAQASGNLGITGIGQCLDQAIVGVVDESFLKKSQVRLLKQRENKNVPDILLITPDLDTQWKVNASDIVVGGYINASTCINKATGVILDPTRLGDIDLSEYNAEIHMADEFFTDKIAVFYRAYNAMPNVLNNKVYQLGDAKVNIVLPVKKRLLDYLKPDWLAQHTTIKVLDQDITVTMELPVSNKEHPLLPVSKTYHAVQNLTDLNSESDIEEYDMLPLIQVWPNIKLREPNKWNAYYTYFDSGKGIITDFHATPIYEGEGESIHIPDTTAEITRSTTFPEAFACEQVEQSFSGDEKRSEIGLLLLNLGNLDEISTQNLNCKIGIDFGTTNTTAYMKLDGDQPQLIHFKNRKYAVTLTRDAESITTKDETAVRQNFISEQEQPNNKQSSIKTMYHANPESAIARPFFSGNIYYIDQSQNIAEDASILKNIKTTDMKWDQAAGIVSMQGFLMQLCLQCLLEAIEAGASNITWMFSYPRAFSIAQLNQYQNTWTISIFDAIKKASTLKNVTPNSLSESESVAEYFKDNMRASIKRGMLCLDIGGGSTDIAIWQDRGAANGLINQTSLRFAGRNILNEYIWNRKEAGHSIFLKLQNNDEQFTKLLSQLDKERNKRVFDVVLEALLRDYEDDIFQSLTTKSVEPEVALMIRDITFALSGVFFYCGMLVGYLRKQGKYDTQELLPNCYIGGNASKLLNWTAEGRFSPSSLVGRVYKQSLLEGFRLVNPGEKIVAGFELNMTDRPKQEVAYGLVTNEPQEQEEQDIDFFDFGPDDKEEKKDSDADSALLAGEKFEIDNVESNNEIITADEFLKNLNINRQKPENFQHFLTIFNKMMKKLRFNPIEFTDADFVEICTQVNQVLSDKKEEANDDPTLVEPEPLFILVLKEAYLYLSTH